MMRSKLCLMLALVPVALGTVAVASVSDHPEPIAAIVTEDAEPSFTAIDDGPDPFATISDGPDPLGAIGDDPEVVHPFWTGPTVVCVLVSESPDGALCFVGIDDSPSSID